MVSDQLRKAIQTCGLSQNALALRAGVEPAALNRFVHGKMGLTTLYVDRLCEALGLELKPKARKSRR